LSIESNDDEQGLKIAPGAPTISQRLDLISKLRAAGHEVIVGVNPCTPEWLPRPKELLSAIAANGASGIWVERLHLNYKQIANISEVGMAALTPDLIDRIKKKTSHPIDIEFTDRVNDIAHELGLATYTINQHEQTDFFEPFARLYPKRLPTSQEFINHCHKGLKKYDFVTFEFFWKWLSPALPAGRHDVGGYVKAKSTQVIKGIEAEWSNRQTFLELMAFIWCESRLKISPAQLFAFAFAITPEGQYYLDDVGLPMLMFFPDGVDKKYCVIGD
jgi:hypothetical protein